ncbi:MAG: sodium:calcium antiporter [bacterium]|nr:sodium:calcium antiporter [bacterium]
MMLLSLVVGFMLLFAGGEMVVRGAVALARRFEVAALVFPLAVNPGAVRRDSLFMAAFTAIFIIVALGGSADRYEGALMLAALVGYVVLSLWQDARVSNGASQLHREEAESMTGLPTRLWLMVLFVVGGLLSVVVGADHLVGGATALARDAGVPDEVIGLTLVAVGTSLPEVATAIVAAYRRHADICIGNVIGSNIFNLFGILGITALAAPVPFSDKIVGFDLWVLGAMTLLLVPLLLTGWRLGRRDALLLLALYCVYILSQFQELNDLTAPV